MKTNDFKDDINIIVYIYIIEMSREQEQQQKELNKTLKIYLDNVHILSERNEYLELETKMGGIQKSITRINYDNVIKKLKSLGFISSESKYLLRIQSSVGESMTNIRTEIEGLHNVRRYCQANVVSLERPDGSAINGISFVQKQPYMPKDSDSSPIRSIDYPDFDFRISLMNEKAVGNDSAIVNDTILNQDKWKQTKKVFRYTNRHTFTHPDPDYPFIVDVSIVKSSRKHSNGRNLVAEYTIQDAGVFKAAEKYEIEIECVNANVGIGTKYNTVDKLNAELKKMIKNVLAGFQETNYPISYTEQRNVKEKYMRLFMSEETKQRQGIEIPDATPDNFAGPSSMPLKMIHLLPSEKKEQMLPNINEGYTVTDKADGERKLLYIDDIGKIYLINTNMQVQFTGAMTKKTVMYNYLLDGEHIIHDKHGRFINRYAAFDIYFAKGKSIREREFVRTSLSKHPEGWFFRLDFLKQFIERLDAVSVVDKVSVSPLNIVQKEFYYSEISSAGAGSIFKQCEIILSKVRDNFFDYETDGLIFTPGYLAVGKLPNEDPNPTGDKPRKTTWSYSLKWKPVEQTTIDFLVSTKKNTAGVDDIKYISSVGTDTSTTLQLNQYKTLILMVGYSEKQHSNPYQDMINDYVPSAERNERYIEYRGQKDYVPAQFFPTDPYDQYAGICNIHLRDSSGDEKLMLTEAGEVFEDNTIVEFKYDKDREHQWRWVPIRVRYDKTAELRAGFKNFGNAYHVANDNWDSIHNPVTEDMLENVENVPNKLSADDDVYYNKVEGATKTQGLRNFHNLYVKNILIKNISKPDTILIDLAVGKAGDFPKWINSKLKFVFGIDISKDNIQNKLNGACKRYLNFRQQKKYMPSALFVNGDSSKNIRNADAFITEKDKQITKAVFGQGAKNENDLGKGVFKEYGIGTEGFDICSIQFAVHYMFKNQESLHSFLRNVSETTKLGGYFIGTSYDGKLIFDKLKNIPENDSVTIMEDRKKIWEVQKKYSKVEFLDDATCTGYAIDVYQDSINKYFVEYLVNYTYLTRVLENYGFVLLKKEEYSVLNLPGSTGLFKDLYDLMVDEIKRDGRKEKDYGDALNMTAGERTISFLNRYFIYKKVRNVDALKEMERNLGIGQAAPQAQVAPQAAPQAAPQLDEEPIVVEPQSAPSLKGRKKTGKKLVII